jgi:alpha-beta hydrolase superfamily lysophospholipase
MSAVKVVKRIGAGLAVFVAVAAVVFVLGPRNSFGPDVPTPREAPPADLMQLDDWLAKKEAAYPDILPGAAKGIVWLSEKKEKTPWVVVNIHGFGASRNESMPVTDMIAKALGANRFEARLTGHGRGNGPAMGEPVPQDWIADILEAVKIGHQLGDRVLVIGTSTGATLATWLATRPEGMGIDAFIFVSPNYAPRNPQAKIVNLPWGKQIAVAVGGETRTWVPSVEGIKKVWSYSYPMKAVFPMMALVQHVQEMDLSGFKTPVLMLYSEGDRVINPEEVKRVFARISSTTKKLEPVDYSEEKFQHNLANDITAPKAVPRLAETAILWVKSLPAK